MQLQSFFGKKRTATSRLPPGPREPAAVQAFRFGRDPYKYLADCEREHGDTFSFRLPGDPVRVITSNAEYLKQIFALRPDQFCAALQSMHMNLGSSSVVFLDGERHRRVRKVLHPPIQGEALASYLPDMARVVDDAVSRWPRNSEFVLRQPLLDVSLDILLETVFGALAPERRDQIRRAAERWLSGILSRGMFMISMATTANRLRRVLDRLVDVELSGALMGFERLLPFAELTHDKAALVRLLREELARVRSDSEGRSDLLARLSVGRYEDDTPLEDETIIDQLVSVLVGGHETTASSLGWCFHHLLRHPLALARAVDEARSTPVPKLLLEEDTPYLSACVLESMRLTPVAIATGRTLTKPLSLGPYQLEPGTIVWPAFSLSQRRAASWVDPDAFDPERFLEKGAATPTTFMPWGGGVRRCPGATFSALEMRVVLARVLAALDLGSTSKSVPPPQFAGLTVVPGDGVPVVAHAPAATAAVAATATV